MRLERSEGRLLPDLASGAPAVAPRRGTGSRADRRFGRDRTTAPSVVLCALRHRPPLVPITAWSGLLGPRQFPVDEARPHAWVRQHERQVSGSPPSLCSKCVADRDDIVTVERVIPASPERIFELLADPGGHRKIDGSGSVRGPKDGPARLSLGAKFDMAMKLGFPY